jgi:hypothetical protein
MHSYNVGTWCPCLFKVGTAHASCDLSSAFSYNKAVTKADVRKTSYSSMHPSSDIYTSTDSLHYTRTTLRH